MKPTWHPPLAIARHHAASLAGPTERAYGHVGFWVRLAIEPWDVVREGHLHLLRPLTSDAPLAVVDLSRRPLVAIPGRQEPAGLRDQLVASSEAWLRAWRPTFWRISELGLVSEIGESADGFRHRVQGLLQPELQRRLDRLQAAPLPNLPWRRKSEFESRRRARDGLVKALARVMGGLESWTAEDAADRVRSLDAGLLIADEDLLLSDPQSSTI